jgi:hypothetical protein
MGGKTEEAKLAINSLAWKKENNGQVHKECLFLPNFGLRI